MWTFFLAVNIIYTYCSNAKLASAQSIYEKTENGTEGESFCYCSETSKEKKSKIIGIWKRLLRAA